MYIIFTECQFCGEIDDPKFPKFSVKLCTLYLYEMSAFAVKLNIQNYVNSTENYVHYTYEMTGFADKLNIQNCVNSAGNYVH